MVVRQSEPGPSLAGRVALVTGGTSGLGRVIATGFAAAGAHVVICARTAADCDRVAAEIAAQEPGDCIGRACDLTSLASIEDLAGFVSERFGVLHALVNNAGAVAPGPLADVTEAQWDQVVDLGLKGVFFLTQKLTPCLAAAAQDDWPATIVNIGSFAGGRVGPQPHYPYTAAKAGLRYLTQSLAKGLAPSRITANAIALGVFPEDSGMMGGYSAESMEGIVQGIPARRFGRADDIVGLTRFLASPAASYITGATIPLDGGMHI